MSGTSFSLTEKLAVTGAFLALVALAVGTEDDPGLVVTSHETIKELRRAAPATAHPTAPTPPAPLPSADESELPPPPPLAQPAIPDALAPPSAPSASDEQEDGFSPKLGRMRRDFSDGPPDS